MQGGDALRERLRRQILGQLHVGRLAPGDRLPSIRRTAVESGMDHRAVAAAYRALEEEGVVEIRSGSGVYVAGEPGDGDGPATERWLAEVLTEGWERRMPGREVARRLARCVAEPVRCAVVESNEDHMEALAAEIEEDFPLRVERVMVEPEARHLDPARLAGVELVVTTVFHADVGRAAARGAGIPAVVATLNPDFVEALDARLSRGSVTAVIADPGFRARGEAFLAQWAHARVRFVPVDQLRFAIPPVELGDEARVLITRAARQRLGLPAYHFVPPPTTVLSVAPRGS
jgi:DNA-binding transcriptional regulator YhcF (GntR family)